MGISSILLISIVDKEPMMNQAKTKKDPLSQQPEDTLSQDALSDGINNDSSEGSDVAIPASTNLFNLDEIRLSQDYASTVGVKKMLTTVPIRKPGKQTFFRVHPDPDYRLPVLLLEMKETVGVETYLVMPLYALNLPEKLLPKCFTPASRAKETAFYGQ